MRCNNILELLRERVSILKARLFLNVIQIIFYKTAHHQDQVKSANPFWAFQIALFAPFSVILKL